MNLQETHVLRKLDEAGQGVIETQKGDVLVKATKFNGFVAILKDTDTGKLWNTYGQLPSIAFLNLVTEINKK